MSLKLRRGCPAPTCVKLWIWSRSKSQVKANTRKAFGQETTFSLWRRKICRKHISHIAWVKRRAVRAAQKPLLYLLYIWRGKFYFHYVRESEKNALFWPSRFVSNSNLCLVGNQSCLKFKTKLMLNKFIRIIFDIFIFLAFIQFSSHRITVPVLSLNSPSTP